MVPLPETGEKEIKICIVVGIFNDQGKGIEEVEQLASSVPENS